MSKKSVSPGPGAASLILVVVIVSMSVLCMLSLYSASGELKLAKRAAEVVQETYTLEEMADDTAYKAAKAQETGEYSWIEEYGSATLDCAIVIENGTFTWVRHNLEMSGAFE